MHKKLYAVLIITLLIGIYISTGCSKGTSDAKSGAKAYNFTLKDLDGKTHRLSDYHGKVMIVDIWDTWCPPCKAEIPHFIELYNSYKNKGFVIVGIAAAQYGEQAVKDFVRDYQIPYINLIGDAQTFQGFGGIQGIPTTFIINRKGEVVQKVVGYRPKEFFEAEILKLL